MKFDRTFYVDTSSEEALEFIADFTNLIRWDDSVNSVVKLHDTFAVGAQFDVNVFFVGNPIEIRYTLTEYIPGELAVLTGIAEKAKALDTIKVSQFGEKTRVDYTALITLSFPYSFADRLLGFVFKKTVDRALERLKFQLSS